MHVEVHAIGTTSIARVELVTERGPIVQVDGASDELRFERAVEADFVYARVTQRDGEMAWSSPVFGPRSRGCVCVGGWTWRTRVGSRRTGCRIRTISGNGSLRRPFPSS